MRILLALFALTTATGCAPYTLAGGDRLRACTQDEQAAFKTVIFITTCLRDSPYDWFDTKNPDSQNASPSLCKCTFPSDLTIFPCSLMKEGTNVTLQEHYDWVKRQCECSSDETNRFLDALNVSSKGCAAEANVYDWVGASDATQAQRDALCSCSVGPIAVPRCSWTKSHLKVSVRDHVASVFNCTGKAPLNVTEMVYATNNAAPTETPSANPATEAPVLAPISTPAPSSPPTPSSKSSDHSIGTLGSIAGGAVVVALIIGFVVGKRRMKTNHNVQSTPTSFLPMGDSPREPRKDTHVRPSAAPTVGTDSIIDDTIRPSSLGSLSSARFTEGGKWEDPAIIAVRIPYDSIFIGSLLSRGGFGEVLRGTYRGETVAIKRLLPERRKDLAQIDNFLSEVKLMSSLEHERIVKFIGVAWNSLSDVCLVVEFMEHGDLRSVLSRWDSTHRPDGFDADKIKIALHLAHALVYLHSLQPDVVHRDLKSKNVLLDANFDAKLTDFGIARERADVTMTGGVGSSLWMAPEVMMGKRYDEKADIFSFGVVLSELDTHQLPYSHAKVSESGEKLPEAAILQQVMLGRLSVAFTDRAHPELVQLGRACVRLDPRQRPTTAQVLHRVHQVLRQYTCLV